MDMAETSTPKQKKNPVDFVREVRSEIRKVTWPTRKETTASVVAVFIMVTLVALFLFVADQVMAWGVSLILNV